VLEELLIEILEGRALVFQRIDEVDDAAGLGQAGHSTELPKVESIVPASQNRTG
jgi:hypothetical protein